jgi:hypothetical protein
LWFNFAKLNYNLRTNPADDQALRPSSSAGIGREAYEMASRHYRAPASTLRRESPDWVVANLSRGAVGDSGHASLVDIAILPPII